ncbi:cytochrome P450 2C50-like isoform X2 [Alligator sinensis]|uniref:Cytochrome P450 2C50-like isoform X2 n=1 Tax=Alligator sinensis TaxID=38654 RepID=A0A3Q0HAH6_ALLSI|nr:cytochrome P450 2C50-like isoform X2 [Alligator sinensis]
MDAGTTGILILLLLIFVLCYLVLEINRKRAQLPAGPAPWPVLGNLWQTDVFPLRKHYPKFIKKYGPVFTVWLGSKPAVVLCGYEVMKDALVGHAEEFGGRPDLPFPRRLMEEEIDPNSDLTWRELRRFTLTTLREFGMGKRTMSERIQKEAHFLVEAVADTKGELFEPKMTLIHAVSNVICSVVFGSRFNYKDKAFLELLDTITNYINYFNSPIAKEKSTPWNVYTDQNLIGSVFSLFAAGTTTTSSSLLFCLLVLVKFPHIQAKIHQEIDEALSTNHVPSMEDRVRLPYTNAVIHEVQRYQPIHNENFPREMTRDTVFRGHTIPKGTPAIPLIDSVHTDPVQWETPKQFNPGHFLDENGHFRRREAFMPFSAGKRACPGEGLAQMELFLFLTILLQNFTFKAATEDKDMDVVSLWMALEDKKLHYKFHATRRSVSS